MEYNVGDKVVVISCRNSFYGSCRDLIEVENQEVIIINKIYDEYLKGHEYHIRDLKGEIHCCRNENIKPININRRIN